MDIGQVIATLRKKNSFSQAELAVKVGITQTSLSQIESGRKKPHRSTVTRICEALGIPEQFLYLLSLEADDLPSTAKQRFQDLAPLLKDAILSSF